MAEGENRLPRRGPAAGPVRLTRRGRALIRSVVLLGVLVAAVSLTVATRADAYLDEVAAVDAEMTEAFAAIPAHQRALVTNHHVFGYLAQRYDFDVVGAVIPGGTTLAAPSTSAT